MFFHLQYIHLFRPFLKYAPAASPLPAHVSPRRICTANAGAISKLMRLYKKSWNLRQICNIAVYMTHSACTIHLLNLPEKTAKRDITHGVKHLEEIAEDWLCARRTLSILSVLARKWNCDLPEDAAAVLQRADEKFGYYTTSEVPSPRSSTSHSAGGSEDIGPTSMHQELGQNSAYILSQMPSQQSSIDGRLEMSPQAAMRTGLPPGGPHPSHSTNISVASSPMASGFSPARAWNQSPVPMTPATQGTPNYGGMGMPVPSMMPPNAHAPVPADVAAKGDIDTSQWLLTDSAQWQRNFEGWDLNTAGPPGGFVFGNGAMPAATSMPPDMQQQGAQAHQMHPSQYPRGGMEEYDASLSWLPRLQ